ncbi:MAG: L,D-transpeptidase [Alphaproteobacteria bacterium]|nr:L,D-transpeptidase [Alphaproteobacteria bacterium]
MNRHVSFALVAGAFGGILGIAAASAEPLSLQADRYRSTGARQAPAYIAPQPAPAAAEPEQRIRYASAQPEINLGGGFIEFLFGGGRAVAPPGPQMEMMARAEPPGVQYEAARPPAQRAIDPKYLKQVVQYDGPHKPGTVIIDTPNRFLFLVQDNGTAVRYGIGVGRPGFTWAGEKKVTAKKEWPDWVPPPEMLQRQPDLPTWMAGGPNNPLGARALYLGTSLYRIHGSNEPWTIGQAVSSGCIRMRNEDVIDLYEKVKVGTKVVVI